MQRTYILVILISLTASTLALSFPLSFSHDKPSLLSFYATKSGVVPLYRDTSGFFAYIDINSFESDASDSTPDPQTIPMMLGLYTNQTLFINNCLNFSQYNCNNPICNPFTWASTSSLLPYFTAEGYKASALAYLNYKHWNLYDYAIIGTSCSSNASSEYGNTRFGVLGLGTGPDANANYLKIQSVSIYIEKDLNQGYLYFGRNNSLWDTNLKSIVINSDYNWHIYGNQSRLKVNNHLHNMSVNVIFDVGSDMIGFPITIYQQLMSFLAEESVSCPSDIYSRPVCNYTGLIEDLPNITLNIQRQNITILPEIYVQSTASTTVNGSTITLNMRALSPNLTGECYVTQNYANYIILDMNFMSYYYVTFLGNTVTINVAAPMPPPMMQPETNSLVFIVAGAVGFILLATVVGCCYAYRRKKPRVFKTFQATVIGESLIPTANSSCKDSPL